MSPALVTGAVYGVSSIEPSYSADEMNYTERIASCFVAARGDVAVLLEPGKGVLNQMTSFVQVPVVAELILARGSRWTDDDLAGLEQRVDDPSLPSHGLCGRAMAIFLPGAARYGCINHGRAVCRCSTGHSYPLCR